MKTSHVILLASELLAVSAVALPNVGLTRGIVIAQQGGAASAGGAAEEGAAAGEAAGGEEGAAAGEEGAAEGEEGAANEVEQEGAFDTAIELGGGDVKTDTLFPPGVSELLHTEPEGVTDKSSTGKWLP